MSLFGSILSSSERGLSGPRKTGSVTLVLGTKDVVDTGLTDNSMIFLSSQATSVLSGVLRVTSRTSSTGFTIGTGNVLDTPVVAYQVWEP